MTVTYDTSTNIGKVRLKTGDNVIADPAFTDEEIQVFLDANGDSINLASADVLEAWAAKYTANADSEHIGDYSYTQNIVTKMLNLAAKLRENESMTPASDWAEMDLTAGSGITAEED